MSRAVCSVENSRSVSPYLSPQPLAMWPCSATANVLPLSGLAQSCGTGTVAQSYSMFAGGFCCCADSRSFATSGHGFHAAGPADGSALGAPVAPELGETQRTAGVQAVTTEAASSATTTGMPRRRTDDPPPSGVRPKPTVTPG